MSLWGDSSDYREPNASYGQMKPLVNGVEPKRTNIRNGEIFVIKEAIDISAQKDAARHDKRTEESEQNEV